MARRLHKSTLYVTTILSVSLALQAVPAAAQQEEIIITARKREESILKVPVIATALSGEQLDVEPQ